MVANMMWYLQCGSGFLGGMVDIALVLSVVIEYNLGSKKSFGVCRCGFSGISISDDGNETETVLRIYFITRYFAGFSFVDGFPCDV